jgi:hypothetical protein
MITFLMASAYALTWVPDEDVEDPPGYPTYSYIEDDYFSLGSHTYTWHFFGIPSGVKVHTLGEFRSSTGELAELEKTWWNDHPGVYVSIGDVHWVLDSPGEYGRTVTIEVHPNELEVGSENPMEGIICILTGGNPFCETPIIGFAFGGLEL